jgi:DNA-binding transcriptional LysR family regulator
MDVDTRLLRYFAAVAEEGNLTRAARRLFIAQPALTKQIRQLERQLGVDLFVRGHTGMTLTEPGALLAARVPALLAEWRRTLRATRAAASRAFGALRPEWRVDMRQADFATPDAGLAAGHVDAALLRLPVPDQDALRVEVLFSEPRWAVLPAGHPLAARDEIGFDELRDEPFVAAPPETGGWRDYWIGTDAERDGHPPRIGAVVTQPDDWLSAIANGYGVALAPRSAARFYARPTIVYRPVRGVAPSLLGVAWLPADDDNPLVRDFVRCCREQTRELSS